VAPQTLVWSVHHYYRQSLKLEFDYSLNILINTKIRAWHGGTYL
jgi:hypothetical protein